MTLEEIHAALVTCHRTFVALSGALPEDLRPDTAFALGEADGILSKARALVGRDIDDRPREYERAKDVIVPETFLKEESPPRC